MAFNDVDNHSRTKFDKFTLGNEWSLTLPVTQGIQKVIDISFGSVLQLLAHTGSNTDE